MYTSTICDDNAKGKVSTLLQLFICTSICIAVCTLRRFHAPSKS